MRAEIGRDQISAAGGGRCAAAGVLKLETPAFAGIRHESPLKFSWSCKPGGFEAAAWGLRCTNRWVKSDTGSERTPNEVRYGGYVLRTWGAAQALATSPFLGRNYSTVVESQTVAPRAGALAGGNCTAARAQESPGW